MDELTALREVFGPDEAPPAAAQDRARAVLLSRIHAGQTLAERHRRSRRWPILVGLAASAAAVVGVVAVQNLGTVHEQGTDRPAASLPRAYRASAVTFLENAALVADKKPWTTPRPDQYMYKESRVLRNSPELEDQAPNGPLVPGKTRVVVEQDWKRIDAQVWRRVNNGKLVVELQGSNGWSQIPFDDLVKLTTPEAVLAWDKAPKNVGSTLDTLLGQYVLPPAVQAAVFRAIAQGEGVRMNPDTVNIDGRPAVGLSLTIEKYLSKELLFDKQTYALIGERLVAIVDHTSVSDDGTSHIRKGDVFRQAVYTASIIVDNVGDTK